MRLIGLAFVALALAFPAAAQTISVQAGQKVTVSLPDAKVVDTVSAPATTAFEEAVVKQLEGPNYMAASGANSMTIDADKTPEPDPVAIGRIAFKLVAVSGGKHMLLVIDNGYEQALVYEATMRVAGKSVRTGVCTVGPGRHGFEHWPHPIDSITLSAMRFEPWTDISAPRCE